MVSESTWLQLANQLISTVQHYSYCQTFNVRHLIRLAKNRIVACIGHKSKVIGVMVSQVPFTSCKWRSIPFLPSWKMPCRRIFPSERLEEQLGHTCLRKMCQARTKTKLLTDREVLLTDRWTSFDDSFTFYIEQELRLLNRILSYLSVKASDKLLRHAHGPYFNTGMLTFLEKIKTYRKKYWKLISSFWRFKLTAVLH